MKRKIFAFAMTIIMILTPMSPPLAYANEINVTVNGQRVDFQGQGPANIDGHTMIPVRGVFEMMGFNIIWNETLQQVILSRGRTSAMFTIGRRTLYVNGRTYALNVPPQVIGGRTMMPVRNIAESLGYHVGWDRFTNTVLISSTPIPEPAYVDLRSESGEILDTLLLRLDGVSQLRPLEAVFHSGRMWFNAAEFAAALGLPPQRAQQLSLFELCEKHGLFLDFHRPSGVINLFTGHERPEQLPSPGNRYALMRLEDVTVFGDFMWYQQMINSRIIANLLYEHNAAFTIAWVPIFVRPAENYRNDPRDYSRHNLEFVFTIDYMLSRGGLLGLHGYTHQRGNQNSISGYEFGAAVNDAAARQSFENQLRAAADLNWTPISFTFPKYIGTQSQFQIAAEFFDIISPHPSGRAQVLQHAISGGRNILYINTPQDHPHSSSEADVAAMIRRINNAGEICSFFFHTWLEYDFISIQRSGSAMPVINYDTNSPLHRILEALRANGRVVKSPAHFQR